MSQWTLGEVRLSKRVSLNIQLDCGGTMEPADLVRVGRLLQWVGHASRKWQGSVRAVTPMKAGDGRKEPDAAHAEATAAAQGGPAVRMVSQADASPHVGTNR